MFWDGFQISSWSHLVAVVLLVVFWSRPLQKSISLPHFKLDRGESSHDSSSRKQASTFRERSRQISVLIRTKMIWTFVMCGVMMIMMLDSRNLPPSFGLRHSPTMTMILLYCNRWRYLVMGRRMKRLLVVVMIWRTIRNLQTLEPKQLFQQISNLLITVSETRFLRNCHINWICCAFTNFKFTNYKIQNSAFTWTVLNFLK